tara:strand:- start:363 stop:644 length:282 start_codon:yes stop_codon:yes gene_type:complete
MRISEKMIRKLQKANGVDKLQELIDSGKAWRMEGFIGRQAMRSLEDGATMLPDRHRIDFYGNRIPSRKEVVKGSKGSLEYCRQFWKGYLIHEN